MATHFRTDEDVLQAKSEVVLNELRSRAQHLPESIKAIGDVPQLTRSYPAVATVSAALIGFGIGKLTIGKDDRKVRRRAARRRRRQAEGEARSSKLLRGIGMLVTQGAALTAKSLISGDELRSAVQRALSGESQEMPQHTHIEHPPAM